MAGFLKLLLSAKCVCVSALRLLITSATSLSTGMTDGFFVIAKVIIICKSKGKVDVG